MFSYCNAYPVSISSLPCPAAQAILEARPTNWIHHLSPAHFPPFSSSSLGQPFTSISPISLFEESGPPLHSSRAHSLPVLPRRLRRHIKSLLGRQFGRWLLSRPSGDIFDQPARSPWAGALIWSGYNKNNGNSRLHQVLFSRLFVIRSWQSSGISWAHYETLLLRHHFLAGQTTVSKLLRPVLLVLGI